MRFADLFEYSEIDDRVIDLLSVLSGEGVQSISMESLIKELKSMGIDADVNSLFDEISNLSMIDTIENGIVYFHNSTNDRANPTVDQEEKDSKKVSQMAQKKVDKEIKK